MKITNDTNVFQIAELLGPGADEFDGRILLGLLSRECIVDTEEVFAAAWQALLAEAREIRLRESDECGLVAYDDFDDFE